VFHKTGSGEGGYSEPSLNRRLLQWQLKHTSCMAPCQLRARDKRIENKIQPPTKQGIPVKIKAIEARNFFNRHLLI
jgi:hypothetical protein